MSAPELVRAVGLSLRTKTGPVFTDVHAVWPAGSLAAVTGPAGSGRSSMLLALTGRMRGLSGTLRVAGLDAVADSRRVRALTSVARISGLVELEGRLTVSESITERALIDAVRADQAEQRFAATERQLDLVIPRDRLVDELTAFDRAVLAVGLAALRPSRLIVLDDADAQLDLTGQRRLFDALVLNAAATGTTIVVGLTETAALPPGVPRADLTRPDSTGDDPVGPDTTVDHPTTSRTAASPSTNPPAPAEKD